ncbi:LD-carboxypeptidase [Flaviaesturariibacter amylovorans]|uniref:LD-carboxypeptidase n=2 Tax=Flaviaesturariibacter amylovorans TaxID=1084520 RepID=A0ABP8HD49_9BACT
MRRKHFLSSVAALAGGALLPACAAVRPQAAREPAVKRPPWLKPGDTIAITSPAGAITLDALKPATSLLESWGYRVRIGESIGKKDFSFGGTDAERGADLQALLDDPSVSAILCARGGYGSVRIVDGLRWERFKKAPKWVIGFSDITVLHSHIHRHCGVATLHSKMCNSFPDDWVNTDPVRRATILSIKAALEGAPMDQQAPAHPQHRAGTAEGPLVGGNLRILENLAGTPSDISTMGKILFVEDTGEYLYSIDRMFENLRRSGKLAGLAGLIVGGMKVKPDDAGEEFGRTVPDIVLQKTKDYSFPICFDFPVGHQPANFALKCGLPHHLTVAADGTRLTDLP